MKPKLPARARAFTWIRDGVIRGDLPPGTFIEEATVSEAVGVSRTPVREAFQELAAAKFIDLMPRRGAQVRAVTARELVEVYATRRLIEGYAGRILCDEERPIPDAIPELLEQQLATSKLAANRRLDVAIRFEHAEVDRMFHRTIVAAAGNSVLTELYDALRSRQQRVGLTAIGVRPERRSIIDQEHIGIVDALTRHDGDAFIRILNEHLKPLPDIMSHMPGSPDAG